MIQSQILHKIEWEDLISENENESGNYSQANIHKCFKIGKQNKLLFSDESSSKSSGETFIRGRLKYNHIQSDQDTDHTLSNRFLNTEWEKIKSLLILFFEANLSQAEIFN